MTYEQVLAGHNVIYQKEIQIVEDVLKDLDIRQETDIRIYVDYPTGWHATVGERNRVFIVNSYNGHITLTIEPCCGFMPNGALIRSPYFYNAHSFMDVLDFKRGMTDNYERGRCKADFA